MVVILTKNMNLMKPPLLTLLLIGREWFSLILILCTAQWESICTSSKPIIGPSLDLQGIQPKWRGWLWFSAVEKSDPWHPCCGSMRDASLVWDCMPNGHFGGSTASRSKWHPRVPWCFHLLDAWTLHPKACQSHQETGISWKTWKNYGKPIRSISDHGHDMMHSPWNFVATLLWFIPMLPKHLLVLMRKGVGILSTSKNAKFNEGIEAFFSKLDMEADCPASRISVLLWGWRYNCPEHEHLRLKKPGKNPTVKHKQCVCHVLWPARYDLSCNDLRSNNKGPSLTHCMGIYGQIHDQIVMFLFPFFSFHMNFWMNSAYQI